MTRGRPPATTSAWECHIHLRLREGEDDDLIAFLGSLPARKRATALKSVLRNGGSLFNQADDEQIDEEMLSAIDDFLK
ncbi:MAG: hypothetical protein CVU44_20830 [Chloroflexi bacterium HGW-Chloroflexi-6]|nr:MAG: hypothetical protein CVU44_20830 [Chloroflexi bacterium HGW-Chloroflexi-6]